MAAEKRGNGESARKLYLELLQRFPKSPYAPLGYFAFGELFRSEMGDDPGKLQLATQAYEETLKYPARENPLWAIALLRKAELSAMSGDGLQVMSQLQKMAQSGSRARCADGLALAIDNMLPAAYAASGMPEKAAAFFASFGRDELAATATARLARLYITQQKSSAALAALRGLANSKLPAGDAPCGEALTTAKELGDASLVRDLGAKCKR